MYQGRMVFSQTLDFPPDGALNSALENTTVTIGFVLLHFMVNFFAWPLRSLTCPPKTDPDFKLEIW